MDVKVKLLAAGAGLLINSAALGAAANHSTSEVKLTKNPVAFTGQDNRQYQSQIMTTTKSYFPDRPWFLFLATVSGLGALVCGWKAFDEEQPSGVKQTKQKTIQQVVQNKPPVTIIPTEEEEEDDQDYLEEDDEVEEDEEFDTEELTAPTIIRGTPLTTTLDSIRQSQENQDWIKPLVFKGETTEFRTQHFHVCGATNSGKSTLVSYIVDLVSSQLDSVELFLINPKHIESDPQWSFEPFVRDIDDVLPGLQHIWEQVLLRRKDPSFDKRKSSKIIAIVDEWDWIFEEYGKSAVKIARKITKVGRALNVHIIFSGQSALCTDTGFSTSDYKNVARVVLTDSALQLIGNVKSFPYSMDVRKNLAQTSERYLTENKRFALVVPMGGMPFVSLVPHIELADRLQTVQPNKELVTANG